MLNRQFLSACLIELILNSSKTIDEVRDQFNGEFPHVDQRMKDDVWNDVMETLPELN
jgi:hypothetical protein